MHYSRRRGFGFSVALSLSTAACKWKEKELGKAFENTDDNEDMARYEAESS